MMKKFILTLLSLGIFTTTQAVSFTDTQSSPYHLAIIDITQKGIVQGYSDNIFRPNQNINRAEFIKILLATKYQIQVDYQARSNKSCFTDIPSPAWYRPYACVAKDRGIIDGYTDGSFKASNTVTKAEAVKIMHNFYFDPPANTTTPWYQSYYDSLKQKQILLSLFNDPQHALTRGEMAFSIQQFELYPGHSMLPPSINTAQITASNTASTAAAPTPQPTPYNEPITEVISTEITTTISTEISPLSIVTTPHPGPKVSGGYISTYKQWQEASYAPSISNHTLSNAEETDIATEVLNQVNAARQAAGKTTLVYDSTLQAVAQNFTEHLVINAIYSHSDKLGQDPFQRAKKAGITGFVAESIVWRKRDPSSAVTWWQNSPLHWNNVANARFNRAGVGVAKEPSGGYIVTLFQGE